MVDIHKQLLSFRLKWLGRFLNENREQWKKMCSYWFDLLGGIKLLLNCNYNIVTLRIVNEKKIPIFYKEILQAWEFIRTHTTMKHVHAVNSVSKEVCLPSVFDQIIWHNQHILYDNQSLFYKEWYNSGIVYLRDLLINGSFQPLENIMKRLLFKKSKCILFTAIFDYSRLQKAIPKIWISSDLFLYP